MALYAIFKHDTKDDHAKVLAEASKYISRYEVNQQFGLRLLLGDSSNHNMYKELEEYLKFFNVLGDDAVLSNHEECQRIFSCLNRSLQAGCAVLANHDPLTIREACETDVYFMAPVIKKGLDVFMVFDSYWAMWNSLSIAVRNKIPVIFHGEQYQDHDEILAALSKMYDETCQLTRELEQSFYDRIAASSEVFPFEEGFIEHFKRVSSDLDATRIDEFVHNNSRYKDYTVEVRGPIFFTEGGRNKQKIMKLFHKWNKWRFVEDLSVRNPTYWDLFVDSGLLDSYCMDYVRSAIIDLSDADGIFTLVLDSDEDYAAEDLINHGVIFAESNSDDKRIIIYDKQEGIKRFHELYQDSENVGVYPY